jgi:hypothetical protein
MSLFSFHSPLTFRCFFVHQKPICLSVYVTELVRLFFLLGNRATHLERDDFLAKNEGRYGVLRGVCFLSSLGSYRDSRIESQSLGRSGSGGRRKMRREEWEDGLCKKETGTLLLLLSTGSVQMRWGVGWLERLFHLSFLVICPYLQHTHTRTPYEATSPPTDSGSSIMSTCTSPTSLRWNSSVVSNAGKRLKLKRSSAPRLGSVALLKSGVWIWNYHGAGEGFSDHL